MENSAGAHKDIPKMRARAHCACFNAGGGPEHWNSIVVVLPSAAAPASGVEFQSFWCCLERRRRPRTLKFNRFGVPLSRGAGPRCGVSVILVLSGTPAAAPNPEVQWVWCRLPARRRHPVWLYIWAAPHGSVPIYSATFHFLLAQASTTKGLGSQLLGVVFS